MAYSFRHTDPELAGVIVKEKVRCGKQNCRCARAGRLHHWYYYLYWRDYKNNATLKKKYIPRSQVRNLKRRIKSTKARDGTEKTDLKNYLSFFDNLIN